MRPEDGSGVEMQIYMPDGSRVELAAKSGLIEDILKELKINSEEVIVTLNGRIVAEEETAGGSDELKIFRIVHGG
ncbi:MAG TPA: MoaD/ThiS family protein [Methanothrix soehngenii]|nr:MoaD/ThiS family protein [Methanothrix soehngenii]